MGYRVAVVGATGNVGREMLNILAERQFPLDEVAAVASPRSTGDVIDFGDSGKELKVQNLEHFDFAGWDIALFAAGSEVVEDLCAASAAAAGCTVIDNSSLYRMDPDVPLIVPEVNPEAIDGYRASEHHRQSQLLDRADGRGAEAAARRGEDQARGRRDLPVGVGRRERRAWTSCSSRAATSSSAIPTSRSKFTKQIAFNVIPHIDGFLDDGSTKEEWKMVVETKKILDPDDQGHRDLRPGAGVRRPFGSGQHRVRERDLGRRGAGRSCARRRA